MGGFDLVLLMGLVLVEEVVLNQDGPQINGLVHKHSAVHIVLLLALLDQTDIKLAALLGEEWGGVLGIGVDVNGWVEIVGGAAKIRVRGDRGGSGGGVISVMMMVWWKGPRLVLVAIR